MTQRKSRARSKAEPLDLAPNVESTSGEDAADVIATVAQLVPAVGGIVAAFLSGAVNQRRAQRVAQELHRLYEDLRDHKERVREDYVKTEEFEELLLQTLDRIAKELDPERRAMYRRYLKNLMTEAPSKYSDQRRLLRLADELTPAHLLVLNAIAQSAPTQVPMRAEGIMAPMQALRDRTRPANALSDDELGWIVRELETDGLVSNLGSRLRTTMSAGSALNLASSVMPLGRQLLRYLKE
jgi:hypothetical protein